MACGASKRCLGEYEASELWDKHTFVKARNLLIARLTMLDAHRGGEPARLTLNEWREAIKGSWVDPSLIEKIDDPLEKYILEILNWPINQAKAQERWVPVLITEDTTELKTKFLSERSNRNVSGLNVFLFPNTNDSLDHASGHHC